MQITSRPVSGVQGRAGHCAVAVDSELFVFFGVDPQGRVHFGDYLQIHTDNGTSSGVEKAKFVLESLTPVRGPRHWADPSHVC